MIKSNFLKKRVSFDSKHFLIVLTLKFMLLVANQRKKNIGEKIIILLLKESFVKISFTTKILK
jgi:hypothetical protein